MPFPESIKPSRGLRSPESRVSDHTPGSSFCGPEGAEPDRTVARRLLWLALGTLVLLVILWGSLFHRVALDIGDATAAQVARNEQLALAHEGQVRFNLRDIEAPLEAAARQWASLQGQPKLSALEAWRGPQGIPVIDAGGNLQGSGYGLPANWAAALLLSHQDKAPGADAQVQAPVTGLQEGRSVTSLSRALRGPDDSLQAVVFTRFDPAVFLSFFEKTSLGPRDTLVLLGQDGRVRARRSGSTYQYDGDQSGSPWVQQALRSETGSVRAVSPVDGTDRFYSWRTLPEYGLIAAVGTAYEDAVLLARERGRRYALLASLASLLLVGTAFVIGRGIRRQHASTQRLRQSEERLRGLTRIAADWYWESDPDHRYITVRCAARYGVRYAPIEAGLRPWELPDDQTGAQAWQEQRETAMDRHHAFSDFPVRRADIFGRVRVSLVSGHPVYDESGNFLGYRGVGHDVTEREEAQQALANSEKRLSAIIEAAMDAIVIADSSRRIVVFNAAAAHMFRCPAERAIGQPLDMLLPARFRAAHPAQMRHFAKVRATPRSMGRSSHVWALRADGQEFPVDASISHAEVNGEPLYSVVLRDITERLAAERALRESEEAHRRLAEQLRQSQKMEALGSIAGGIAHDFNNVIAAIQGNSELAQCRLAPDSEAATYLGEISRAGLRARELVRRIMAFSRREPPVFVRQALSPVVREAVALLRSTLPSGIRITLEGEDCPGEVLADGNQIHQVVMNLGTNASQALPGRSGHIEVRLEVRAGEDCIRLSVRDNGSGMDAGTQARMFEPFFTTKPQGEGTGLGLAVVQDIVRSHRGEICVRSSPGQGCTIEVRLPLAPACSAPAGPAAAPCVEAPAGGAPGTCANAAAAMVHVVYVDDYEALVALVPAALRAHGWRVTAFRDSTAALGYLLAGEEPVDLLISDHDMPELTGTDLTAALRKHGRDLPVVLTSGHLSPDLRERGEAARVDALFDKTEGLPALIALASGILAGRRTPEHPCRSLETL